MSRIDRREFTQYASLAFLSGVAVTLSDCGGGYSSPTAPSAPMPSATPPPASGDDVGQISNNHGHEARVTAAELMAGGALSLDIRGTATHTHTVALSAQDVQDVREQKTVAMESTSTGGHSHRVTFNPQGSAPSPGY
jgi:hypothetical protein